VTVGAFGRDYLEAIQNVELAYAVPALLGMVADELTHDGQPLLIHSPFPVSLPKLAR
jgi:hypothetical protein